MKKTRIKASAMLIAQVPAGTETDVVVDENGTVFIAALSMKELTGSGTASVAAEDKPKRRGAKAEDEQEEVTTEEKPKRGRGAKAEATEEAPAVDKKLVKSVIADLDSSKLDEEAAVEKLCEGADRATRKAVQTAIKAFLADPKMALEDAEASVIAAFGGSEAEAEDKPKRSGRGAGKSKLTFDKLEDGQRVEVLVEGEDDKGKAFKDWFPADVKIGRGNKVSFAFDDEQEDGEDAVYTPFDADTHLDVRESVD